MHASTEIPVNELYLSIMKRVRQTAQKEREDGPINFEVFIFTGWCGDRCTEESPAMGRREGEGWRGGVEDRSEAGRGHHDPKSPHPKRRAQFDRVVLSPFSSPPAGQSAIDLFDHHTIQ